MHHFFVVVVHEVNLQKILELFSFHPVLHQSSGHTALEDNRVFLRMIISTFQRLYTTCCLWLSPIPIAKSRPEKIQHKILLGLSKELISFTS